MGVFCILNMPYTRIYAEYASVYDAIDLADAGLQALQHALRIAPVGVGHAIDLGCGTGKAAIWLATQGWHVLAVDRSADMLHIAEGRARDAHADVQFAEGDLRDLAIDAGSVDLVVCLGDTLNELISADDLKRFGQFAAEVLSPSGVLIFDCRTVAEFALWDARDLVLHDDGGLLVYAQQAYNLRTQLATQRVVWFSREEQRWWRAEETHTFRCWFEHEIEAIFAAVGLNIIAALALDPSPTTDVARRMLYIAQR
jgi:SAM-dependent methyltransferase